MPENKNLEVIKPPMAVRFNEEPKTNFVNNLVNISVDLHNGPTMQDLREYLVNFAHATWNDNPVELRPTSTKELDRMILMVFKGQLLPSAMETIKLTFLLEGISYQDVTHILRYRTATFSAECSADKWWSHKNIVVPSSIENSPEFLERYKEIHLATKKLYCDMIDSKEISLIDARYVLTRAYETYYWVSWDLGTCLHFIRHRIDKQIQPESDNVLAYLIYNELIDRYPLLAEIIDIHSPAKFYVDTARTGRCTNLFKPDKDSDIYEWNEKDYLYQRERSEVNGTDKDKALTNYPFNDIMQKMDIKIKETKARNRKVYGKEFFE